MIAAATQNLAPAKMLFNWFDVALVLLVLFGYWRGRKHGMTKECLSVSQWLVMVIAAAFGYQPLADLLLKQGVINSVFGKTFNQQTAAYVTSYLIIALFVLTVFSFIKRTFKSKLEGSNVFGGSEYYLGMVSGMIRYVCMLIMVLALLNAPFYSAQDIVDAKKYSNRWFGGGLKGYSGDFFPTISEVQISVFQDSRTGPFLQKNLEVLLVKKPAPPAAKTPVVDIQQ